MKACYNEQVDFEIGVDESGRGTLFGGVFAGAVAFAQDTHFPDDVPLTDSKKLTPKKRASVRTWIETNAVAYAVKQRDHEFIDNNNIWKGTHASMCDAILDVMTQLRNTFPNCTVAVVIDGNRFDKIEPLQNISCVTVEKADALYRHVAAASILAKEYHDDHIKELIEHMPSLSKYGLSTNMGYATSRHCQAIADHGPSPWHRKTFGKVKEHCWRITRDTEQQP